MADRAAALSSRLQFYLLKGMNKALRDYQMIADGDRIAVAVSGGKDSLTLLRLLWARRLLRPDKYALVAIHVASDAESCGGPVDRAALLAHISSCGIECQVIELPMPTGRPARPNQSPCFHCAWQRRKSLFEAAVQLGCNKIAFGHHADDLAETTLLNLFFQGRVETMEPRRPFFGGKLTLIRPLAYIEEKEIIRFAQSAGLPPPPPACRGADRSQRELMRQVIAQVRAIEPRIKINLFRAAARSLPRGEEHCSVSDGEKEE